MKFNRVLVAVLAAREQYRRMRVPVYRFAGNRHALSDEGIRERVAFGESSHPSAFNAHTSRNTLLLACLFRIVNACSDVH